MRARIFATLYSLVLGATCAHGGAALFVEEPYGSFGGFNPTGHAAVYLSHVCAESPVKLRPCAEGETGVVISRYHRVGGYDWLAIPLIPYLYAVERADQIPASVNAEKGRRDTRRLPARAFFRDSSGRPGRNHASGRLDAVGWIVLRPHDLQFRNRNYGGAGRGPYQHAQRALQQGSLQSAVSQLRGLFA